MLVMIGGGAEALSIAIAVFMVLTRRAWPAQAAIAVGFGTALASTYGHLLPTLVPGFQDSFVSPPHLGVTRYSWVSLAAATGTELSSGSREFGRCEVNERTAPKAASSRLGGMADGVARERLCSPAYARVRLAGETGAGWSPSPRCPNPGATGC
jgi:hypothetical protein